MRVEKKLGGSLVDKPRSLLFQDGGCNLCISIEEISYGWKSKSQVDQQVGVSYKNSVCLPRNRIPTNNMYMFVRRKYHFILYGVLCKTIYIARSRWKSLIKVLAP